MSQADFLRSVEETSGQLESIGIYTVEEIARNLSHALGIHTLGKAGAGMVPLGYRPYREGDDSPADLSPRHKLIGENVVQEIEKEERHTLLLGRAPLHPGSLISQTAAEIEMLALGEHLASHDERVFVMDGDELILYDRSFIDRVDMQDLRSPGDNIAQAPTSSTAVLWGQFYDLHHSINPETGEAALNENSPTLQFLKECEERGINGYLIKILGLEETEFFSKPTQIIDADGQLTGVYGRASRPGWQAILTAHLASLQATCLKYGFELITQPVSASRARSPEQILTAEIENPLHVISENTKQPYQTVEPGS